MKIIHETCKKTLGINKIADNINGARLGRNKAYDLEVFLAACCSSRAIVIIDPPVFVTTRSFLNLGLKDQVLDFLISEGIEDLKYINTLPWEKNPQLLVDAYEFLADKGKPNEKCCYLAFLKTLTNKWFIKSLHEQKDEFRVLHQDGVKQLTHKPFGDLGRIFNKGDKDE